MTAGQFLEIFVSVSLQATLYVGLCQWLCRWTSSDETRSQLWTGCQLGLLALVAIACSLPHLRLVHGSAPVDPQQILATAQRQFQLGQVLAAIWSIGAAVSFLWLMISALRMLWYLHSLQPLADSRLSLTEIFAQDRSLQGVRVYKSPSSLTPFCWQFQQPVLVLPEKFLSLEHEDLKLILKHELAHLRANHPLHLFIQQVVHCIYWFHPAVYWAGRQTDIAREMMCDAAAAGNRNEITNYLKVLLKVMEQGSARQPMCLGLGFLFQRDLSTIARRARRLAERARPQASLAPVRTWLPGCLLLFTGLVTMAWCPVNVLSSNRSYWSACPFWTADILHDIGVNARDYEIYDGRLQVFDGDYDESSHRNSSAM